MNVSEQDALDRAIRTDQSGQKAEAIKLYHLAINAIYEGLSLKVPAAWLTGSNVNKWRSELNDWLQGATDRCGTLTAHLASTPKCSPAVSPNSSRHAF